MTNTTPAPDEAEVEARAEVSRNVRIAMARAGIHTVSKLAEELNAERRWVSRRLDGEVDYTLGDLLKLAAALETTPAALIGGA